MVAVKVDEKRLRLNREIRIPQIRVVDAGGVQLGIMTPEEGRKLALDQGLDLVEVAPEARPPVCRIMDYGKYRYEQSKNTKPQKSSELKTLQLGTNIGPSDLAVKLEQARKFLSNGDRVRFIMKLRGRERGQGERFVGILTSYLEPLLSVGKFALRPSCEGRDVVAQVDPGKG